MKYLATSLYSYFYPKIIRFKVTYLVERHLGALGGAFELAHVLREVAAHALEGFFVRVAAGVCVVNGQEHRVQRLGHAQEVLDQAPESAALFYTNAKIITFE